MADQIHGYNFKHVTAAGTPLIIPRPCVVHSLSVLGTGNGTLSLYSVPTVAGTAAGNNILNLGLTAPTVPQTVLIDAQFNNGLIAIATGTVNVGISWS